MLIHTCMHGSGTVRYVVYGLGTWLHSMRLHVCFKLQMYALRDMQLACAYGEGMQAGKDTKAFLPWIQ